MSRNFATPKITRQEYDALVQAYIDRVSREFEHAGFPVPRRLDLLFQQACNTLYEQGWRLVRSDDNGNVR